MAKKTKHNRNWRQSDWFGVIGLPLMMTLSSNAVSEEFTIQPSVALKETYNDNIFLTVAGAQSKAYITEISPQLNFRVDNSTLKLNSNLEIQKLIYRGDANTERTNNIFNANSTATFVKNLLFFDANGAISQQNLNPFGALTSNNLSLSTNRQELRTYSLSPYLKSNFNPNTIGEIRFSRDSVESSQGSAFGSKGNTIKGSLTNGSSASILEWNLQYSNEHIFYNNQPTITLQSESANLTYHFGREFSVNAGVGYEKNNYVALSGDSPEGKTWTAGFTWTPSERTSVAVSGTKHYFGDTYSVTASERTFATVWSLGYNEGLITSRDQFLIPATTNTADFLDTLWKSSIPNQAQRQQAINAFIANTGLPSTLTMPVNTITNLVYLQKNLQASMAVTGARNTVIFSLFDISREEQSLNTATAISTNSNLLSNTKQTGCNILWTYNISPRTSAVFTDSYIKTRSESNGSISKNNNFTTAINYQLQPKLKVSMQFEHINNSANFGSSNFKDNLVSLTFLLSI
ncbi:TIGR03016 family PEP-CTERM system-associated outer membrane protein [Undibacterium sp. SXout20W]|uniref:TIGR03016 family PEP-CTERM system-associated outer membrane protein n=1 Tax=Undibacterium sp. SXout20W TaxID=3413051 RepID=UPI003BF17EB1